MGNQKLLKVFLSISMLVATTVPSFADIGELPKTLQNYKAVHDEVYAQKIVENQYTGEEITIIEKFLQDTISQSDLSMAVPLKLVDSIIDTDKFKSSVERFWDFLSNFEYDEESISRRYATPEFFRLDYKDLNGSDYEKYGFLSCKNKQQDYLDTNEIYENYGNVIINFKKDNLINRTTLTIGDSLNKRHKFGKYSITPTFINDPRIVCIPGYYKEYAELLLNNIKSGQFLPERPNLIRKIINPHTGYPYFEYFELQIHGDLKFSRDVQSVDIIRTYVEDENERKDQQILQQRLYQRINDLGIPCNIIDCTNIRSQTTDSFTDYPTPELSESFQTEDGKIMLKAPEGIFKAGSKLCAKFLDPDSDEYYNAFKNLDDSTKNITERLKVYDIFILDPYGNKITQFDDYVTLYIQIPENYDESDLEAIHITENSDGQFDEWIETIEGKKYLAFKTNHFSPYAIIDKDTKKFNFIFYTLILILVLSITFFTFSFYSKKKKSINI